MRRTIIAPADPGAPALAELKDWLGIRSTAEDSLLMQLLRSALDACEGFTGTMPLAQFCAETLTASGEWQRLSARPVSAITEAHGIPAEGAPFPLPAVAYEVDIDADGAGRIRVIRPGIAGRVEVRYNAGLASGWATLPDPLRHGAIRLAVHLYRSRDTAQDSALPAAVAALWRPWRQVRLA